MDRSHIRNSDFNIDVWVMNREQKDLLIKVDAPLMIEYMANQIEINKSLLIMLKNYRNRDMNGVR